MIGFGPVSRPPPRRAAVMRAGAKGPVGGGSTSENHRMPDVWPHRNRLLSRPFPLAGSSSKVAKSPDNVRSYRLDTEESINLHKCLILMVSRQIHATRWRAVVHPDVNPFNAIAAHLVDRVPTQRRDRRLRRRHASAVRNERPELGVDDETVE